MFLMQKPTGQLCSSTYRDLANHREILRLALETSGYNFRGMEHFGAQQDPPLDVCLRELETCEVYVGIVGILYGSSPPSRVLSYTKLEYNRAKELGNYIIILVINDHAQLNISQIEQDPDKIRRLNRFRDHRLQRHKKKSFNNEHEAAWKILAALRIYEILLREEQHGIGALNE
jgi:hypothetical protein